MGAEDMRNATNAAGQANNGTQGVGAGSNTGTQAPQQAPGNTMNSPETNEMGNNNPQPNNNKKNGNPMSFGGGGNDEDSTVGQDMRNAAELAKTTAVVAAKAAAGDVAGAAKDAVSYISTPEGFATVLAIVMIPVILIYSVFSLVSSSFGALFNNKSVSVVDEYMALHEQVDNICFVKAYNEVTNTVLTQIKEETGKLNESDTLERFNASRGDLFGSEDAIKTVLGRAYMQTKDYVSNGYSYPLLSQIEQGRISAFMLSEDKINGFNSDIVSFSEFRGQADALKNWDKAVVVIDYGSKARDTNVLMAPSILYRIVYKNGRFMTKGVSVETLQTMFNRVYDAKILKETREYEKDTVWPALKDVKIYDGKSLYELANDTEAYTAAVDKSKSVEQGEINILKTTIHNQIKDIVNEYNDTDKWYYIDTDIQILLNRYIVDFDLSYLEKIGKEEDIDTEIKVDASDLSSDTLESDDPFAASSGKMPTSNTKQGELLKKLKENQKQAFIEWLSQEEVYSKLLTSSVTINTNNYTTSGPGCYSIPQYVEATASFEDDAAIEIAGIQKEYTINVTVDFCDNDTIASLLGLYVTDETTGEKVLDEDLVKAILSNEDAESYRFLYEYLTEDEQTEMDKIVSEVDDNGQVVRTAASIIEEKLIANKEELYKRGISAFLDGAFDSAEATGSVLLDAGYAKSDVFWQFKMMVCNNLFNRTVQDNTQLPFFFDKKYIAKDNNGMYKIQGPYYIEDTGSIMAGENGNATEVYAIYCNPKTVVYLPSVPMRMREDYVGAVKLSKQALRSSSNAVPTTIYKNKELSEVAELTSLKVNEKIGVTHLELEDNNYNVNVLNVQTHEIDANKQSVQLTSADYDTRGYLTTEQYVGSSTLSEYFDTVDENSRDIDRVTVFGTSVDSIYMENFDGNNTDTYPYILLSVQSKSSNVLGISNAIDIRQLYGLNDENKMLYNSSNGYCWPLVDSYSASSYYYLNGSYQKISEVDGALVIQDTASDMSSYYRLSNMTVYDSIPGQITPQAPIGINSGNTIVVERGTWSDGKFQAIEQISSLGFVRQRLTIMLEENSLTHEDSRGVAGTVVAMTSGQIFSMESNKLVIYNDIENLFVEYENVSPLSTLSKGSFVTAGSTVGYCYNNEAGDANLMVSVYTKSETTTAMDKDISEVKATVGGTVQNITDNSVTVYNPFSKSYYTYENLRNIVVKIDDTVKSGVTKLGDPPEDETQAVIIRVRSGDGYIYYNPLDFFAEIDEIARASQRVCIYQNGQKISGVTVNKYRDDDDLVAIQARVLPSSAATEAIDWTVTEGTDIISLETEGGNCKIKGVKSGYATIVAKMRDNPDAMLGQCEVFVPTYISQMDILDDKGSTVFPLNAYDVQVGNSVDFNVRINEKATFRKVTWSIEGNGTQYATIDSETGVLKAIKGMVTDTDYLTVAVRSADVAGYTQTFRVRTVTPVESLQYKQGASQNIVIRVRNASKTDYNYTNVASMIAFEPATATYKDLSFVSSNPNIAYVDESGKIILGASANAGSSVTITAKLGPKAAKFNTKCNTLNFTVNIRYDVGELSMQSDVFVVRPSDNNTYSPTDRVQVTFEPKTSTGLTVPASAYRWSSSNKTAEKSLKDGVLTITSSMVSKLKETFTVTATYYDKTVSTTVHMIDEPSLGYIQPNSSYREDMHSTTASERASYTIPVAGSLKLSDAAGVRFSYNENNTATTTNQRTALFTRLTGKQAFDRVEIDYDVKDVSVYTMIPEFYTRENPLGFLCTLKGDGAVLTVRYYYSYGDGQEQVVTQNIVLER